MLTLVVVVVETETDVSMEIETETEMETETETDVSVTVTVPLEGQVAEVDDVLEDVVAGETVLPDVVVPEGQVLIVTVVVKGSHVVGAQVGVQLGRVGSRVLVDNVDWVGDGEAFDVSISVTGPHWCLGRL